MSMIEDPDTLRAVNESWHHNHYKRVHDVEGALWKIPRFEAAMGGWYPAAGTGERTWVPTSAPPEFNLLCPQGHKIIRAAVDADHNWHPYLRPVDEESAEGRFGSARWSLHKDPEMHPHDTHLRVRLRCPACTYDGVLGADRLLALAGVAVARGRRSLRLTD